MRHGDAPLPESTLYALMLVAGFVEREFAQRFARHRLTLPEWRILLELHRHGPDSGAAIARRTGLSAMNVSRAAATLIAARRIAAAPDPADRRRQRLALTAAGEAIVARVLPEGEAMEARLLEAVSARDRPAVTRAVRAMLGALRADGA